MELAGLFEQCNLRNDAAILLQFSHAQLPQDRAAPHSLPAGSDRQGERKGTIGNERRQQGRSAVDGVLEETKSEVRTQRRPGKDKRSKDKKVKGGREIKGSKRQESRREVETAEVERWLLDENEMSQREK